MAYTSIEFYLFLLIALVLYYMIPLRFRWIILLAGSIAFYFVSCKDVCWILFSTALFSYIAGLLISYLKKRYPQTGNPLRKTVFVISILFVAAPWFIIKHGYFVSGIFLQNLLKTSIIAPLGISFYTLQIISYLADVHKGKIQVQRNPAKYILFILFFPHIIQGPIPRYEQLANQLYEGHSFDETKFVKSIQLIIWAFFLKLMIADKAAVIVNAVFDYPEKYAGCYIWTASALYNIQLYTDFLACVTVSQGVAGLFGIELIDNFRRPFFSTSIKEFWRRWHISLSEWLRDYIYIPLGGSRKGKIAKYGNLFITFAASGIWHGAGYKYIVWGLTQVLYQIAGELTLPAKNRIYRFLALSEQSGTRKTIQCIGVFFWTALSCIIFGANSLRTGLSMIKSLFTVYNPWIFFDDSLLSLGLDWKEWCIMIISILILFYVSLQQEKGLCIRDIILKKSIYSRWLLYVAAILCIMIFGTYGFGFKAQDFIYGGF